MRRAASGVRSGRLPARLGSPRRRPSNAGLAAVEPANPQGWTVPLRAVDIKRLFEPLG